MMMRCVQLSEWGGDLTVREVDVPDIGSSDVLVNVEATSVGLTVYNAIKGALGADDSNLPRIPGHEVIGTIESKGESVTHLAVGDRVAGYFYHHCGHCEMCLAGRQPMCENLSGFLGVDSDGGYGEYTRLPATNAVPLPTGVDPVDATVIPDAVATPYHIASRRGEIEPDDDVLILGAGGGVGIHLVQMAVHFGGVVTAVDQTDEKLQRCEELGAEHTFNTLNQSLVSAVRDLDIEYDVIVDFTGADDLIAESLEVIAPFGRFVNLTTILERPIQVDPVRLVRDEIEVVGSRYCSKAEFIRGARLVADGKITPVISEVVPLEEVPALLRRISRGEVIGRGAMTT